MCQIVTENVEIWIFRLFRKAARHCSDDCVLLGITPSVFPPFSPEVRLTGSGVCAALFG